MITSKDIDYIARLSRITLTDEETAALVPDVQRIVAYMDTLNRVSTEKCEPTAHVLDLHNVTRPDTPVASLSNEDALASAPDTSDGCFRVPRILP